MSFWVRIFGSGAKEVGGVVTDIAKTTADIVDRWAPSDAAKHGMYMDVQKAVTDAVAQARTYDPRTSGTTRYSEIVNVSVDALQRLIRPGVTIMLVGGVFGLWEIKTSTIDPIVLAWGETVVGFWFGVRTLTKDIPTLIKMLVELRRGK